MQTRHPLRAALAAMCVPLVMIAVFGNAWFTEHVLREPGRGQLAQRLLATLAPFTWTFTPRQGRGAGTIWLAQWLGILVVLGGTFLITWLVARHAVGGSLFLGGWGTTVPVAMAGAFVTVLVSYGAIFGDAEIDGLGRFWHAVFQSPEAALWGAGVGILVGATAAALVGGVDREPTYVMSAPIPGSEDVWPSIAHQPAPPSGPPVSLAPPTVARPAFIGETVVTSPPTAPPSAPGP